MRRRPASPATSWSPDRSWTLFRSPTRPSARGSTDATGATTSCSSGVSRLDEADPASGRGRDPFRDRDPRDPLAANGPLLGGELPLGLRAAAGARLLRLPRDDRLDGLALDGALRP